MKNQSHEDFTLPPFDGEASLLLRPLWLGLNRASIELVVGFAGPRQKDGIELRRVQIEDIGHQVRVPLPKACRTGGILRFIRLTPQTVASPISLARGQLVLQGSTSLAPAYASMLLSLRVMPWALFFLAIAMALSIFIAPDIQFLGMLGLVPVSITLPFFAQLDSGTRLASGMCSLPSLPQASLLLLIVTLMLLGVFWPRSYRAQMQDAYDS